MKRPAKTRIGIGGNLRCDRLPAFDNAIVINLEPRVVGKQGSKQDVRRPGIKGAS